MNQATARSGLPVPVGERAIRARVGDPRFDRGQACYAAGGVFDARRTGAELRARCEGSAGGFYRVEAALDARGLARAACTCPVGEGGACKHVAAVLLAWADAPERFRVCESTADALARRSHADLVALLGQMLALRPELESLLAPTPANDAEPPDALPARERAGAAMRAYGRAPEAARATLEALDAMLAPGEGVACAGAVFAAVLGRARRIDDEDRRAFDALAARALGLLVAALAGAADVRARRTIVGALADAYRFEVESGALGAGARVTAVLVQHTAERADVAARVREFAARSEGRARRLNDGFALDLAGDTLDDARFEAACRATGRLADLAARWFDRGEHPAAEREARAATDADLARVAGRIASGACAAFLERVIAARVAEGRASPRLTAWLRARYTHRGDRTGLRALAVQRFRAAPDVASWRAVRALGEGEGWPALRAELLAGLEDKGAARAEVLLDEGELAAALRVATDARDDGPRWTSARVALAHALAATRPEDAVALYQRAIEATLRARGRAGYPDARDWTERARHAAGPSARPALEAWAGELAGQHPGLATAAGTARA